MGFAYDSEDDVFEDTDFQKKMMKLSLQELQQRNIIKKNKQGGGSSSSPAKPGKEESKTSEQNGPSNPELDDFEIKKL